MAIYFLDSSDIVKHYQAEVGTAEVDRVLSEPNSRHCIFYLLPTRLVKGVESGIDQAD